MKKALCEKSYLIASLCFLFYSVNGLKNIFIFIFNYGSKYISTLYIAKLIFLGLVGIAILLRKNNMFLIGGLSGLALISFIQILKTFNTSNCINFALHLLLLAIGSICSTKYLKNFAWIDYKMWFLPVVCLVINTIFERVTWKHSNDFSWQAIIMETALITGTAFFGIWTRKIVSTYQSPEIIRQKIDLDTNIALKTEEKTIYSAKEISEQLRIYKELLDDGIITEEEFIAKKEEVLGLQVNLL